MVRWQHLKTCRQRLTVAREVVRDEDVSLFVAAVLEQVALGVVGEAVRPADGRRV